MLAFLCEYIVASLVICGVVIVVLCLLAVVVTGVGLDCLQSWM